MIKRILFLFMISLFLVACDTVEPTPTIETPIETPIETTEPTEEPIPEPKEIDIIQYTQYHHFVTANDEIVRFNHGVGRLLSLLGLQSFQEAYQYVKPFVDEIEIDADFLGFNQSRSSLTYFPIGVLDDFIVHDQLSSGITNWQPVTHYVTQTHRYGSRQFLYSLIFSRNGTMYHFNEMVEDMGYDIHVLAHIFNLEKYRIEPFEQVDFELPEGVAINYEHLFFLDGERYTLGQARVSNAFDEEILIDLLPDAHIMIEELLFFDPIEHPYYRKLYYNAFTFLAPIPLATTHYRNYVFDLEGYAYYYKTRSVVTPYYVLYEEELYTIEDVLIQGLLTFEELNRLIGLQREALIMD